MPRLILTITLLLLFLLEGTVLPMLTPSAWGLSWTTVPRFALVGIVIAALCLGRRDGLYYGLGFGLLQDILYGEPVGVYALTMMVAGYFSGMMLLLFHRTPAVVFTTVALVLFGHEWLLYIIFRLFSASTLDVQWVLTQQILPTVALNTAFALLAFVPLKKLAEAVLKDREHGEA